MNLLSIRIISKTSNFSNVDEGDWSQIIFYIFFIEGFVVTIIERARRYQAKTGPKAAAYITLDVIILPE